jgi:hypothetical protein
MTQHIKSTNARRHCHFRTHLPSNRDTLTTKCTDLDTKHALFAAGNSPTKHLRCDTHVASYVHVQYRLSLVTF